MTTPPVPSDDQGADELAISLGKEERVGIAFKKYLGLCALPGAASRPGGSTPQAYDFIEVVKLRASDRQHHASLVLCEVGERPVSTARSANRLAMTASAESM